MPLPKQLCVTMDRVIATAVYWPRVTRRADVQDKEAASDETEIWIHLD